MRGEVLQELVMLSFLFDSVELRDNIAWLVGVVLTLHLRLNFSLHKIMIKHNGPA